MAVALTANKREDLKTSNTKALRTSGEVPAIIYGYQVTPQAISVNSIDLLKTVRDEGRNAIISLQIDGDSVDVMLHEYQIDPIKDSLVHVDFYAVNMKEEREVQVPIVLEGEAVGVKQDNGVLQQPLYEISILAKPGDIPEQITVDVSELGVGDSILVSDVKAGSNYEIVEDGDTAVVSILVPNAEPEPVEEQEEPAEPEVINQKSSDDDEE